LPLRLRHTMHDVLRLGSPRIANGQFLLRDS
jgi:hypothetical protein